LVSLFVSQERLNKIINRDKKIFILIIEEYVYLL
jgi:hypothetical protein